MAKGETITIEDAVRSVTVTDEQCAQARACRLIVPGMIMGNTQKRNTGVPTETPTPGD